MIRKVNQNKRKKRGGKAAMKTMKAPGAMKVMKAMNVCKSSPYKLKYSIVYKKIRNDFDRKNPKASNRAFAENKLKAQRAARNAAQNLKA